MFKTISKIVCNGHIRNLLHKVMLLQLNIQDSVGEDLTWDLVFVDNHPMNKRTATAARLLKRTKVLIIHDTEELKFTTPPDFM